MITTGIPFIVFVLFLMTGLTFVVFNDPYIQLKHKNTLLLITLLCVSLVAQNYAEDAISAGTPNWLARTLIAIYGYSARPAVIVLFYSIVAPKRRTLPFWGLVIANALIHLTALFSRLCFWISHDNHYHSGPLGNCCLVVSLLLLIWLLYLTFREYRNVPKKEIAIPLLTVAMILVAIWMDYQVGAERQPVSFLTIAMTVSCVLYYIWLHTQFVREHEEDLKARQRIRIMMSQIQPHFLYNTLSTIQALCETDPEKAAAVTDEFSNYLRQNLTFLSEAGVIPFWKELDHTKAYVKIEEMRFPNIKVQYGIHDTEFSVPPMTLQPLVENSIRHGVRVRKDGVVQIFSRRLEECHEIVVTDNGIGFDVSALKEDAGTDHIGIRNVRGRIESLCGGRMTIESEKDKGTTVRILIPDKPAEPE